MSRAARGYLLVAGSFLIMGLIGVLVDWATAPESALLVLRFAAAGLVLGVVFARRHPLAGAAARSVWPRLLLMAAIDALALLLFFVAIRGTSVAIGMFLQFLAPVWVALIAPRILRARTEAIVYPALAIALAGLAVILAPSLRGRASSSRRGGDGGSALRSRLRRVPARGQGPHQAGLRGDDRLHGGVARRAHPAAPRALADDRRRLSAHHSRLVAGVILGVVCTALAYTMWTSGMGLIKVQHSSILGYLEPVVAPLYALLLLGQGISVWTVTGGALIVIAGLLVVLFGEHEEEARRRWSRRRERRSAPAQRLRDGRRIGRHVRRHGVWVGMTDLPASTVLCMRMALAAVMVAMLGGAGRWLRQWRLPGVRRRLLALGLLDALQLYTFMLALRHLDVALAVFLSYMSPVYIALVAPRLLRQRTNRSSSLPCCLRCRASSSCWLRVSRIPRSVCRASE